MHGKDEWGKTGGWLGPPDSRLRHTQSADDMLTIGPPPPPPKDPKYVPRKMANTTLVGGGVPSPKKRESVWALNGEIDLINLDDTQLDTTFLSITNDTKMDTPEDESNDIISTPEPQVQPNGRGEPYRSAPLGAYREKPAPAYCPTILLLMARDDVSRGKSVDRFDRKQLEELHVTLDHPDLLYSYGQANISELTREKVKRGCHTVYFSQLLNEFDFCQWRCKSGQIKKRDMLLQIGDIFVNSVKKILYEISVGENFYVSW